jgi:Domain of unknown function (DUF4145)
LDFDASALPESVQDPLEEAIACHSAECFRAAAVMVRRALEAVCEEQGVKGKNLYDRIEQLGARIVLPKAFVRSLQNLRLLGNDAAHIEAKVYEEVGEREIVAAIDVAKVILQATYQMGSILDELEGLKAETAES